MRILSALRAALVFALVVRAAAAQPFDNQFGISPDAYDATSRSGVPGSSSGDVLVEVRGVSFENPANGNGATGADFVSVGDLGIAPAANGYGDGRLTGFVVTLQDQDASTAETFDLCIVSEGTGMAIGNPAAPTGPGAGDLFRTAALTTPPTPESAWTIQVTLATPADVLPAGYAGVTAGAGNSSWYYGVGLSANGLWTSDGLSVHLASFDGLGRPFMNVGDNPRDGVVGLQQARDRTNGVVVPKSLPARTKAIWILTEAPVLNAGASIAAAARVGPDPSFGAAGCYPDPCGTGNTGRVQAYGPAYGGRAGVGDGIAFRLRSGRDVGLPVVLLLGGGQTGPPGAVSGFSGQQTYLPFFDGAFVLGSPFVSTPAGVIPASGELTVVLVLPSAAQPLCSAVGQRLAMQCAISAPSALRFSNGASVRF